MHKFFLIISVLLILLFPSSALAVPPPDFIIQATSQIWQILLLGLTFFLAFFSTGYQFLKAHISNNKRKYVVFGGILGAILLAVLFAFFLNQYLQNRQIKQLTILDSPINSPLEEPKATSLSQKPEELSQRQKGEELIRNYYQSIAEQDLNSAYTLSTKEVSLSTFTKWYQDTTQIDIEQLNAITDTNYEIYLTLFEGSKKTNYQVEMELEFVDQSPVRILASRVRPVTSDVISESKAPVKSLSISNQAFAKLLGSNNLLVLDAREDLEYDNGNLPGSLHIRFADLKAGDYTKLDSSKDIVVLCWSGIRGREVAEFLQTKELNVQYLEGGANGWVEFGGLWEGNIKFADRYIEDRYRLVFTTSQVRDLVKENVIIVDSREPEKFSKSAISGSFNIPLMHTSTANLEQTFTQLPAAPAKVITVCDGYVNCFDAKLTGVELEKRGYQFLGRYNRPWEF